ncbi:MAG TPA: response regulator, partial [Verrucomicrobiae bacterium]|nr:response regulator [Verrucomicrobiae bacterium]
MMGTGSKKVLVIDDDLSVRQAVRLSLSHQGCKVSDTDNAESGFEMALLQQPDLVISDVNMQGISGLALLSKLRSNPATSAIPVILMTGAPDSASVRCSMEHGADDYLPKPFSHSVLIAAVRARLERQESLLSSAKANEERLLGLLSATRDMVALVDPSTQR